MFTSLIERIVAGTLIVLVLVLAPLTAWNWWRKNVYHDALKVAADQHVAAIAAAQTDLNNKLNLQALDLHTRSNDRARTLQAQIDELASRPPAERVVYKLRDRWLPTACPAPAAGGTEPTEVGGLRIEDELFLVRFAESRDAAIDERNSCIAMYEAARAAVLKATK